MPFLEGVGDVLKEDEAEDNVLVDGGVHVAPELVGGGPERSLEAEVRSVAGRRLRSLLFGFRGRLSLCRLAVLGHARLRLRCRMVRVQKGRLPREDRGRAVRHRWTAIV